MPDLLERLKEALADRYAIEREIGRGGMAVVFLAEDLKHHRKVAIKVLHPELSVTLAADRFLHEIEIVAGLEHPHILTLIDSGESGGLLYYIMPYVTGESLRQRLEREGQLPVEEALRIAAEVADGLDYAHRQGVIHRDVKPGNILLSDRHAVIADFGIARAITVAGGERVTSTGLGVGTPLYASPEQATGAEHLDGRTDIYALGCVLYEMLSGEVPLSAPTPQALQLRRMTETPSPLHPVRQTVPPSVDRAIAKALARLPADRWETADQFRRALLPTAGQGDAPPASRRLVPRRGVVVAILILGLLGAWQLARRVGPFTTGLDRTAQIVAGLDKIGHVGADQDWAGAFAMAIELDDLINDDSVRSEMWSRVSRPVTLRTDPAGALASRRDYAPADAEWQELGRTPVEIPRFPKGLSRVRFELEGHQTREVAYSSGSLARASPFKLDAEGSLPAGMTRVAGGVAKMQAPGLQHLDTLTVADFLVGDHEVTNQEYKAFVDGGGYRDTKCWRHTLVRDGREFSIDEAMAEFTDRTGRPGPSTWEVGTYLEGTEDLPVGGVSWYEAAAFACFAGSDLPTVYHWYFAADPELENTHLIVPLSNFDGEGPAPAGQYSGVSRYGVHDMAGNVREWARNASGEERYILGGAWNDPEYAFTDAATTPPFDRSAGNGIRLVMYSDTTNLAVASAPIVPVLRDFSAESSVSEQVFDLYELMYAYDQTALNSDVLSSDTTASWVRERIELDAAYGDERLTAYLFLPRTGEGPHQTVVFFPGSWAIHARSYDNRPGTENIDFLPISGRAVLFPVYEGTFERGTDLQSDVPDETNLYRDHVIRWAQDLRRSIDYLETRPDIDMDRLAYLGLSWGGLMSGIMTAIEPRFRASVIWAGGLLPHRSQPMVDPFNFLPRVTVPTLLMNGRLDSFFPVETAARPLFETLGTPEAEKRFIILDTGHWILQNRNRVIQETLDWLDRYLGPVGS